MTPPSRTPSARRSAVSWGSAMVRAIGSSPRPPGPTASARPAPARSTPRRAAARGRRSRTRTVTSWLTCLGAELRAERSCRSSDSCSSSSAVKARPPDVVGDLLQRLGVGRDRRAAGRSRGSGRSRRACRARRCRSGSSGCARPARDRDRVAAGGRRAVGQQHDRRRRALRRAFGSRSSVSSATCSASPVAVAPSAICASIVRAHARRGRASAPASPSGASRSRRRRRARRLGQLVEERVRGAPRPPPGGSGSTSVGHHRAASGR